MFKNEEMEINLGPQHPSTHGVLRVKLRLDGETITHCRPMIGYLHRGVEKICENQTFFQGQVWTDRMDYCSAVANNLGWAEANEKLFGLQAADLMPPTLVSADPNVIVGYVEEWGRGVLKPTDCMAGRGIHILDPRDPNLHSILDTATLRGQRQVVVQQWIEGVEELGDRRVIVLDGEPIGAVRRVASGGDFRCNMAAGALTRADEVTDRDREICARLAPLLRDNGLHFVGLDVIGDYLTEVNVTSPTGLREIDALSGTQLSDRVVEWIETVVEGSA